MDVLLFIAVYLIVNSIFWKWLAVKLVKDENLVIKVKYFDKTITPIEKIHQGDWIDLRVAEEVNLKAEEYKAVPLGVGMILPEGYEAIVAPRSSTFKRYGIFIQNSFGIIDNSYSGENDQWHLLVYATRDAQIPKDERICQFRIQKSMGHPNIEIVEKLHDESRGGIGSTNK